MVVNKTNEHKYRNGSELLDFGTINKKLTIIPPKRSATAPVIKPPIISTTRTSDCAVTLANDKRRDNVSTLKNLRFRHYQLKTMNQF